MSRVTLDIVIVSYNTRLDLCRCLDSIAASAVLTSVNVFVIDNASSDGSAEAAERCSPRPSIIRLEENVGFARASNIGIRAGAAGLVLLLNSDAILPAGSVDAMTAALLREPQLAALGPRLVDGNGRVELSFGRMISPWNELRQKVLVRLHEAGVSAPVHRLTRHARRVDWVSGACLLVRRTDAEAVGLLDERYFMYAEDVDFCAALRARGKDILFWPDVQVVHNRGRSRSRAPAATAHAYRRSQLAFYAKHHPRWHPWLARYLRLKGVRPPASAPRRS